MFSTLMYLCCMCSARGETAPRVGGQSATEILSLDPPLPKSATEVLSHIWSPLPRSPSPKVCNWDSLSHLVPSPKVHNCDSNGRLSLLRSVTEILSSVLNTVNPGHTTEIHLVPLSLDLNLKLSPLQSPGSQLRFSPNPLLSFLQQ